jgi:phage shock protein E
MRDKGLSPAKPACLVLAALLVAFVLSCCSHILFPNAIEVHSTGNSLAADPETSLLSPPQQHSLVPEGYRAVCHDGSAYIAVGTNGRIDKITADKTVTRLPADTTACLNGVASKNGIHIAVGDGGAVLYAKNGEGFKQAGSATAKPLYGVTVFHETFWAAGADGTLIYSSDGEHWAAMMSGTKNSILSISANEKMCMAVTRESEILTTKDGQAWDVMDYNAFYEGCSEPCLFRSVRACGDVFFVTGEYLNRPGSPVILSSDTAEIWSEHLLYEINDKPGEEYFPLTINAVAVDWDQLTAACNDGKMLTVTECLVCNKLDVVCDKNINDLAPGNGFLALVGDGFWFDVRKSDAFRQYAITAEQALKDFNEGAFIVDVRTEDEYARQHVRGCMHIPIDELEAELERKITDKSQKVIFYCQKGVRAQQALEKALLMGYEKVYNLGGIGDWPYETETGSAADRD